MTNFDTAREALETSLNSSGSAMREHEKWQQSLEAQINKLKASWQGLSQAFLSSDFLHGALDAVIGLVDGLTKLIDTFGAFPTLMGTVATGFSVFKNKGFLTFDKQANSVQLFGAALTGLKGKYTQIQTAINRYNSLSSKSLSFQEKYKNVMNNSSTSMGKYLKGLNGAKASFGGYIGSLVGATIKTIALEAATIALNAAITMGVSLAIQGIVTLITKWINADKELAESVEEVTTKFKEQHDELKKLKGDYDTSNESSMISKYEKLSKGVDGLGKNVSLTSEEYSEYQSIVNKIAEQIPSLVAGYDSQGNALLSCKGNVEELTAAYEKLIHAQNQEVLTNAGNIEKDFANTLKDKNGENLWGKFREWNTNLPDWAKNLVGSASGIGTIAIGIDGIADLTSGNKMTTDTAKVLNNLLGTDSDELSNAIAGLDKQTMSEIKTALKDADVDVSFWSDGSKELEETIKNDSAKIKGIVDNYFGTFAEAIDEQKTIIQAKLSEAFDVSSVISGLNYGNINEELQTIAYQTMNALDLDFFEKLSESGKTTEQWTNELLKQLDNVGKTQGEYLSGAFELQTQFNGGDIDIGDYIGKLKEVEKVIDRLNLKDEAKNQLKISLGLDENGIIEQYDALVKRLTDTKNYDFDVSEDQAKSLLDSFSSEELPIAVDVITDMSNNDYSETADEIRAAIEREIAKRGLSLDLTIEQAKLNFEALSTAISESVSGSGLSEESISAVEGMFKDLESYDPSKLFERTANGIHLNNTELRKLNDESKKTNVAKINKQMNSLGDIYNQTREELYNLTYGTDEYNSKLTELNVIEQQIKSLEKLAAGYDGVASAYQEWQMAESAGSQRSMYEGILEGWENVEDEISRGWIDDGTREFLGLLKGEKATIIDGDGNKKEINIATASAKDLKKVWKSLDDTIKHTTYSVEDFFTVDDDGNSTSKGVYNFLDAIGQMEEEKFNKKDVVKRDDKGNIIGFDFQMVGGDKVIAEALGISEELVQIMKRASADAGFVVTLDGSFEQLDILREKAQKASEVLNKALKNKGQEDKVFSYNFNSTDEKDIAKQLENANKALNTFKKSGKIDLSIEGASEALTVASTLQSMLDNLQRPAYMKIEVSQVEKDLQDPLRNLQELQTLTETEHQFKISGADTSELEKSKQEIYNYFETLDPEVKAKLGLVDDKGNPLTGQALKDKLNSGDISIEATIDIQMEMDEKLGILVDKALYDAGIIDKKEFEKRVNVYLKADEVDDTDVDDKVKETFEEGNGKKTKVEKKVEIDIIEEKKDKVELDELINNINDPIKKKVIVEYFAEHDEVDDYTPNQKKALVEFIANTDNLEEYTPEEKQAIVEYLTDSADPDSWTPEQKEAVAKFIRESGDVDSYTPDQKEAIAKFIKDSVEPDSYIPPSPDSIVTFYKNTDDVDMYDPPNFTRYVTYYAKKAFTTGAKAGEKALENRFGFVNGTANSDGSAFINGTAFKQGDWRTKRTETALTGELGREIVVTPQNRWYTVGDNGAEFVNIPRGSIVFNHRQTEELLSKGKATSDGGRARALVNGNAFLGGTAHLGEGEYIKSEGESESIGNYSKNKSSSDTENKFEDTIDWIETILDRAERAIDKYEKQADNVYKTWAKRNEALTNEIAEVSNTRSSYEQAKNKYLSEANAVGLRGDYAEKVRNGSLSVEDFAGSSDEKLVEKIKNYQDLYNKYLDCVDKIDELREQEASLYAQRFENVQSEYDNLLQGFDHTQSMIDEYISQAEAKGQIVSKNYYNSLISNEKSRILTLKNEQAALIKARDEAVANNEFDKYSEDWYRMCAEIDAVTQAIEEGTTSIIEYNNAIRDIEWETFDLIQQRISDVTEEADFLIELMSNKKLYEDDGKLTSQGLATMGLHGQNYNTYMYQSDDYAKEIAKIDKQLAKGYSKELEDRRRELIGLHRDMILAAEDEKNAIRDMVEEGINLELDALQEKIDLYNEALESQKDLYDYQKRVEEQTKNIASLQKQLSAYEGDNSEEAKAKIQELKISLEEAEADLEETQYDKYIADQSALLDNLYEQYSETLNTRLDNVDALLEQVIKGINLATGTEGTLTSALGSEGAIALALSSNATSIGQTLKTEASNVGTTLSNAMNNIWNTGEGNAKSVLEMYGNGFQSKQTTTNTELSFIKSGVNSLVSAANKEAEKKVTANTTTTSAKKNPTTTTNKNNSNTISNTSSNTNAKTITDNTLKSIAAAIWVYGSKAGWEDDPTRKNKLSTKLGATNAKKVQEYINKYGTSGELYKHWYNNNLKLSSYSYSAFKLGARKIDESQLAWTQENGQEYIVRPSDGAILTPVAKGDSILTSAATNNIWQMANSPAEFIKDNLNLGTTDVPNNSSVQNSVVQNFEKVVFSMPNVRNYQEFLSDMQKDKNFERLVKSMTIDQIAGKSSLAKGKAIR